MNNRIMNKLKSKGKTDLLGINNRPKMKNNYKINVKGIETNGNFVIKNDMGLYFINRYAKQGRRLKQLNSIAITQMKSLINNQHLKKLK